MLDTIRKQRPMHEERVAKFLENQSKKEKANV
jgi:hypothetical protein